MGIWDDLNAAGGRLAEGYDPRTPDPPKPTAPDVISKIFAKLGLTPQSLTPEQARGLYNTVIEGVSSGKGTDEIVNAVGASLASLGQAVDSGNKPSQFSIPGRLDVTTSVSGAPQSEQDKQLAQAGFFPVGGGKYLNAAGTIFDSATGTRLGATTQRSAGEENASNASAAANYAAANRSNVLAGIDLQNAARAGQEAGPGFTWMPDGSIKANGKLTDRDTADIRNANAQVEIQRQNSNETGRHDLASEANESTRLANDASYQQGQLGIGQEGNRLRGTEIAQTGAYQQGQLAQGEERLTLDKAVAAADAAAKAQQNNLARQQYISKVLSSPSDFISRAFMQRGEASPISQVTHADLINQINREYAQAPTAFTAPQMPNANLLQPDAPAPPHYAFGTQEPQAESQGRLEDPAVKKLQGSVDAVGKLLQHIKDPVTLHRLVDELSDQRGRLQAMTAEDPSQGGTDPSQMQAGLQRLADGGMVNDRVAVVGDPQVAGVPNPEVIHNPTGAPISVTPMNRLQQPMRAFANGTPVGWDASTGMLTSNGTGANISGVGTSNLSSGGPSTGYGTQTGGGSNSPQTQTTTSWSSAVQSNPNAAPYTAPAVKAAPTGYFNYENPWGQAANASPDKLNQPIPNWISPGSAEHLKWLQTPNAVAAGPVAPEVTQAELVAKAESNLPPALRQLFGGTIQPAFSTINRINNPENPSGVNPLSFGFNLFSPQALSQLTDAEKQALDSYLGVKYNTSLADVTTGMEQSFGRLSGGSSSGGGRLKIG